MKQKKEGSLLTEGSSDILTMALGTPEHSGRIRGLGLGPTPTTYFKLPRRGIRRQNEMLKSQLEEERKKNEELQNKLKEYEAQGLSQCSEKVGSNTRESVNKINTESPSHVYPEKQEKEEHVEEIKAQEMGGEEKEEKEMDVDEIKVDERCVTIDCKLQLFDTFQDMIKTMNESTTIQIPIQEALFGRNIFCYLDKKNLLDLCSMEWLDVSCIIAYER